MSGVALAAAQQPLAEELERWHRDPRHRVAMRAELRCRKCRAYLGRLSDLALDDRADGTLAAAPFGAVLELTVYDEERAETIRRARRGDLDDGRVIVPGVRYAYDRIVSVFIERPGAPDAIDAACPKHGRRSVTRAEVERALADARRPGGLVPLIHA